MSFDSNAKLVLLHSFSAAFGSDYIPVNAALQKHPKFLNAFEAWTKSAPSNSCHRRFASPTAAWRDYFGSVAVISISAARFFPAACLANRSGAC